MMAEEAPEALENFGLEPFEMKVQGLDRTLADKVFAICDYYMQERVKSKRLNFRHGYKNPRPHFCNRSTLIIHI